MSFWYTNLHCLPWHWEQRYKEVIRDTWTVTRHLKSSSKRVLEPNKFAINLYQILIPKFPFTIVKLVQEGKFLMIIWCSNVSIVAARFLFLSFQIFHFSILTLHKRLMTFSLPGSKISEKNYPYHRRQFSRLWNFLLVGNLKVEAPIDNNSSGAPYFSCRSPTKAE